MKRGEKNNSRSDELFSTDEMAAFVLQQCRERGWISNETSCLEPASGDGIFLKHFQNHVASMTCFDIKPRHDECIETDFLTLNSPKKYDLVVGNPPFGRRNQLALLFLNKAMQISDRCVFILPKSFLRPGTIDLIDRKIRIIDFCDLPTLHFRIPDSNKLKKIVAGVFLFEKQSTNRPLFKEIVDIKSEPRTARPDEDAEYAIIHSGGGSGRIVEPGRYAKGTTYSLIGKKDAVANMDWSQLVSNGGAGQLSLTLTDIHLALRMKELGLDYHSGALGYLKYLENQK